MSLTEITISNQEPEYSIPGFGEILAKVLARRNLPAFVPQVDTELSHAGYFVTARGTVYRMETCESQRRFINVATGQVFEMRVRVLRRLGQRNRVTIIGLLNGEIAANQNWNINPNAAARYGTEAGFIARESIGINLAFDHMMSQLG